MLSEDDELREIAREIETEYDYDCVVVCAGDSGRHRVKYGFDRGDDQTFREVVGTVQTCLHLVLQDHFFGQYLSAFAHTDE